MTRAFPDAHSDSMAIRASTVQTIRTLAPHWDQHLALIACHIAHKAAAGLPTYARHQQLPQGMLSPMERGLNAVCAHMATDGMAYPRDVLRIVVDAVLTTALERHPPHPYSACHTLTGYDSAPIQQTHKPNLRRWVLAYAMGQLVDTRGWTFDHDRMALIHGDASKGNTVDQAIAEALGTMPIPPPSGL